MTSARGWEWLLLGVVGLVLLAGSLGGWLPIGVTEVLGFVTGAASVWLVVRQSIWTWPVGIANNLFFIVLFWESRLYADMALQGVYIVLSVLGCYWWLRGGANRTALLVSRASRPLLVALAGLSVVATLAMREFLVSINDAAPSLDALTTVLSLVAQFLLTRKHVENWYVWITADVLYIYLYLSRELYLTAVLYAIFLGMCLAGLRYWHRSLPSTEPVPVGVVS